jgi:hypothetical protein
MGLVEWWSNGVMGEGRRGLTAENPERRSRNQKIGISPANTQRREVKSQKNSANLAQSK